MPLKADLEAAVKTIFKDQWQTRDGQTVPESEDIQLGNHGVKLEAAILYADLASSTDLVDRKSATFAAECYKSFLHCASKVIRNRGGFIRSFDGDRVMGIFIGDNKNSDAARCALEINWAVKNIVQPGIKAQYPDSDYVMEHKVGIDCSSILVARTGIRGSNDLVWVGGAANHAAKLCALNDQGYATFITERVYKRLSDKSKLSADKIDMWERRNLNDTILYRSSYWWALD